MRGDHAGNSTSGSWTSSLQGQTFDGLVMPVARPGFVSLRHPFQARWLALTAAPVPAPAAGAARIIIQAWRSARKLVCRRKP